jgi:hypothetical protein
MFPGDMPYNCGAGPAPFQNASYHVDTRTNRFIYPNGTQQGAGTDWGGACQCWSSQAGAKCPFSDFSSWQKAGLDAGSTVTNTMSNEGILAAARARLFDASRISSHASGASRASRASRASPLISPIVKVNNCYDKDCTTSFATAHLDTSLPCSGGCYTDKANETFCDSASNFTCFPDRIEYTQHVGVKDCSAGAIMTVHTSVHTKCTQSKNHEGIIYNQLVNYSGC